MLLGVLILLFLWFRPAGLVPERRRRLARAGPGAPAAGGGLATEAGQSRAVSP